MSTLVRQKPVRLKPRGKPRHFPVRLPPNRLHSQWLQSGRQTLRTRAVIRFAEPFSGTPIEIAQQALTAIRQFEQVPMDLPKLERYYAKRTADEVIRSKKIVVASKGLKDAGLQVCGCIDYSVALAAVLRAKGIPCKFVRERDSSFVYFADKDLWWSVNPVYSLFQPIGIAQEAWIRKELDKPEGTRQVGEGLDAWDIGIRSIADFKKFGPPKP